jgi:hypothetical protein
VSSARLPARLERLLSRVAKEWGPQSLKSWNVLAIREKEDRKMWEMPLRTAMKHLIGYASGSLSNAPRCLAPSEMVEALPKKIRDPLVTVWPAFKKAMYLLNFSWGGRMIVP